MKRYRNVKDEVEDLVRTVQKIQLKCYARVPGLSELYTEGDIIKLMQKIVRHCGEALSLEKTSASERERFSG